MSGWEAIFRSLYGMHKVLLNKLKAFLKANAQAGRIGLVIKTSEGSTVQDNS
jgi:hypothetical protein